MKNIAFLFVFLFQISFGQNKLPKSYLEGIDLFNNEEYQKCYPVFTTLLNEPISDSLKAECNIRLGFASQYLNNIDSAIIFFRTAGDYFNQQKNNLKTGRCYEGIAKQYYLKDHFQEARFYHEMALEKFRSPVDSAKVYLQLMVEHLEKAKIDSAYFILENQLSHFPDSIIVAQKDYYVNEVKGLYLREHGKMDSALICLKRALIFADNERYKSFIYIDISNIFKEKKEYQIALQYLDSANRNSQKVGWAENLQLIYNNYKDIYFNTQNYKLALLYADSSKYLSDSLFNLNADRARLDAEARYQNEKTRAEKAIVEKDNKLKQRGLVFSFIGLGLIALLAFMGLRSARIRKKANNLLTQQKIAIQNLADELSVANDTKARLFSTIGHDLRNPLSSLYAQIKLSEIRNNSGSSEISKHTTQLLDTLEELLVWSKSQMDGFVVQKVKLDMHQIFEELKDFYQGLAEMCNVYVQNNTAENIIVSTDENILKTVLRNLISNAIDNTQPGKFIVLNAKKSTGNVRISVKNACSKEAFDLMQKKYESNSVKSNAHGFGTLLVKEFAQKLNAKIDLNYDGENAVISFEIAG